MNIFKVIKKVLSEPTDFFTRVKQGKNHVGFSWVYFALLSLFNTILGSIMFIIDYYIFLPTLEKDPIFGKLFSAAFSELTILAYITKMSLNYIGGLILIFLIVGVTFIWIKIFRGKSTYRKTFELVSYAQTPSLLFGWIPFVGFSSIVWSFILLVIGTEQIHELNRTRTIIMYAIPLFLFVGLMIVFWIIIAPAWIDTLSKTILSTVEK